MAMSVLSNFTPETNDPVDVTLLKILGRIRQIYGQTDADTRPETKDEMGVTLRKILTVYNRI